MSSPASKPKRPRISANFAMTWDGRISTRRRTPSDFTSAADKARLLELRALADAVLVSATTAKADRMTMGLPKAGLRAQRVARGQAPYPLRVLLSHSGRIDPELPVFQQDFSTIVLFSTTRMPPRIREALARRADLHLYEGSEVKLPHALQTLREEYGIRRAHCEGGGRLLRSFLEEDLLDELYLTLCPRIFGSATAPTISGFAPEFLRRSVAWNLVKTEPVDDECFLHYRALRRSAVASLVNHR